MYKQLLALCREAERLEEDATYSSEGHFNAKDTWVRRNYWRGVPATVLGAVAGATLIKSQPEWATAFTLLASLLTGLMTFLKPNERAAIHRAASGQFLALRNEARFFPEIELLQSDRLDELPERLKALSAARNELNLKSPEVLVELLSLREKESKKAKPPTPWTGRNDRMSVLSFLTDRASIAVLSSSEQSSIATSITTL